MAMDDGAAPRGLDDLRIVELDSSDLPPIVDTNLIDVVGSRALNFNVESDSDELEGDNSTIAIARDAKKVTGSVELGLMNLDAIGTFTGGTPVDTGTGSSRIIYLEEDAQSPTQYIQIIGQAPDRRTSGCVYRVTIYKALVTSGPDESMTVNEWSTPTLDFEGTENPSGKLLRRTHFADDVAITLVP